jgi:tRNA (cmo5U34)-methyltransferase
MWTAIGNGENWRSWLGLGPERATLSLMETDQVREHFRIQVPNYAGLMERLIPFYEGQRDLMMELMPLDRSLPLRVLDLGCGPGLMASRILAEYPQAQLTLIDMTTEMIDVCRSRLEGFDCVTYRVADFRTDDFGDGFDVIVASLSFTTWSSRTDRRLPGVRFELWLPGDS